MNKPSADIRGHSIKSRLATFKPLLWTLSGFLAGLLALIPVYAIVRPETLIDYNLSALVALHAEQPLLWVVDSFPLVAAICSLLFCRNLASLAVEKRDKARAIVELRQAREDLAAKLDEAVEENNLVKDNFLRTTAQLRLRLMRITSPDRINKSVRLEDIVDSDRLQEIQQALTDCLDVYSAVYDLHGDLVTRPTGCLQACRLIQSSQLGEKECYWFTRNLVEKAASHLKPVFKRCHLCGLVCGGAPLIVDDRHLGTWIIGQVRFEPIEQEEIIAVAEKLQLSPEQMLDSIERVPEMNQDSFESALNLLWYFTREVSSLGFANLRLSQNAFKRIRAENEARLVWQALNLSGDAVMITSHKGEIIAASDTLCDCLGYRREELVKLNAADIKAESPEAVRMPSGREQRGTTAFRTHSGEIIRMETVQKTVGKDNHKYTCIIGRPATDDVPTGNVDTSQISSSPTPIS